MDSTRQVYNLGNGGVPVHHDNVDGIWTNHEIDKPQKMTMGTVPILDFRGLSISHPQGHGEMGPPQPPKPAGGRQVPDPTMTEPRNMSQGVNLLYLFRYQIGGDFVST